MATVADILNEWAADSEEKQTLIKTRSGLCLRWINQAQLRFADKSEVLKGVWQPTITSSGNIALPSDFLREYPDLVTFEVGETTTPPLIKVDYPVALNLSFSSTTHYSIFNGTFYVWAAGALTPSIPYIKKPATLTAISSDSLTIPTEFHHDLIPYLDMMWDSFKGKITAIEKSMLLKDFDNTVRQDGIVFLVRNDNSPKVRSGGW